MRFLRQYTEIGMPFHGLAVDGTLATLSGDKAINGDGAAILLRNPAAPGVNRNAEQLAVDAAKGFEWRDYMLLTGGNRAINGGPELGANTWLYCDPAGTPWVMTFEQTANASDVTFELWRRALFGRFGRRYEIVDELLDTFTWSPQLPSWYTGALTAADIVPHVIGSDALAVVPSADGASVIVNIRTERLDHYTDVFPETFTGQFALVGILDIALAGIGDPLLNGVGITGTMSEAARFEDDLVISRVKNVDLDGDPAPTFGQTYVSGAPAAPPTPAQADANAQVTGTESFSTPMVSGWTPYYLWINDSQHQAIVYRTHRGDIKRQSQLTVYEQQQYAASGTIEAVVVWEAYWDASVPKWRVFSCNPVTGALNFESYTVTHNRQVEEFDIFGAPYGYDDVLTDRTETVIAHGPPVGSLLTANCLGAYTSSYPPDDHLGDAAFTHTVDGLIYPSGFGSAEPRAYLLAWASNLFGVWKDYKQPDSVNRRLTQYSIGSGELVPALLWSDVSTWLQSEYESAFPVPIELVHSFQPVTMEYSHAGGGVVYQYC